MSSSAGTVIPKGFCGLRVLLIEPDKQSLQHHADILKENTYQVTTTTEASVGLSLMMSGNSYDCVLVDADMYETDNMEAFLHQVLRNQPNMSIALMVSVDSHLKIPKEALESEAVFRLLKPCSPESICDIWKHICRNRILLQENVSKKNDQRVDPRANGSTVNNSAADDNNISSSNLTDHQALDSNSQVDHAKYKQVAFDDLFCDDDVEEDDDVDVDVDDQEDVDENSRKKTSAGDGTTTEADKGKQPNTLKRTNDQRADDDEYYKRYQEIKTRVRWRGELDEKFRMALRDLGDQALSSDIAKHMNVPGLTRFHVASHLQKYHKKRRIAEASMAALGQESGSSQAQSFANKRCHYPTQCNDNESYIRTNSHNNIRSSGHNDIRSNRHMTTSPLNLSGILYVFLHNIRAKFQQATPLSIHNYGGTQTINHNGDQGTGSQLIGHGYGNAMQPQVTGDIYSHHAFEKAMAPSRLGATMSSGYNYGRNDYYLPSRDTQITNQSGGQGPKSQPIGNVYGNAMEPQVTGGISSHRAFEEAMVPSGFGATMSSNYNFGLNDTQTTGQNGGQGTASQMIGHVYGNATEPQVTGNISSHHAFEEALAPSGFGATVSSNYNLGLDENYLLSGSNNAGNSGDANGNGHSQVQEQVACFEPEKESWVADCGAYSALINDNQDALTLPDYLLSDIDYSVNPGSSLDTIPLGPASADLSFPDKVSTEENDSLAQMQLPVNSSVSAPLDGSQGGLLENGLSQSELEYTVGLLYGGDEDGNLVNDLMDDTTFNNL